MNNQASKLSGGVFALNPAAQKTTYLVESAQGSISFNLNIAGEAGGAIYQLSQKGTLKLSALRGAIFFKGNRALRQQGGAIYCQSRIESESESLIISANEASSQGGFLFAMTNTSVILRSGSALFSQNKAVLGALFTVIENSQLELVASEGNIEFSSSTVTYDSAILSLGNNNTIKIETLIGDLVISGCVTRSS